MSLTASYRTEIVIPKPQVGQLQANVRGTPCMEIMRLALEKIAREREGTVTDGYQDCAGKHRRCIMGLRTRKLPRGLGVTVEGNGQIRFEYDRQGADIAEVEGIGRDLDRAYNTIGWMRALKRQGYQVSIEQERATDRGQSVRIVAVKA